MSSPDEPQDLSQIRHVETGDPVASKVTSQPTRAIELRLKYLEQLILQFQTATSQNQFIIPNVSIQTASGQAVGIYDAVFFNPNTGFYEQGLATVTSLTNGFVSNPTAFTFGIVVAVRGPLADVMVGGYQAWVDSNQQNNMLQPSETYQPGVPYFLSATYPGKLTRFAPTLRIQVLIGTDQHFVLAPSFATPESIENIYAVPAGMRPVGSLRAIGPDYEHNVIVGFDALELYSPAQEAWRSTSDSTISDLNQFGYLLADATVTTEPSDSFYIGLEVALNGSLNMYSAPTLADLFVGGPNIYNVTTSLLALSDTNKDTLRSYPVYDTSNNSVGTVQFRFVSNDRSFLRKMVFKFPDDFQGWKMIHAPVSPLATAILLSGVITGIKMSQTSVGFSSPPVVVITDSTGSGATAIAVLDDWGCIASVQVTAGGSNYTSPTITFDTQLLELDMVNGGSGAEATASSSGGLIDSVVLVAGGTGYLSDPDVIVVDSVGSGTGAVIIPIVRNGQVVELKIANPGTGYASPSLFIVPKQNQGYQITDPGTFTATVVSGAVTSALVTSGGHNYPAGAQVHFVGIGTGAAATLTLDGNGTVTGIAMTSGGTGYDNTTTIVIDTKTPELLISGGNPFTAATGHLNLTTMGILNIDIASEGMSYSSMLTITPTGGLGGGGVAAQLSPVLDGNGRVIAIKVLSPGSGYLYAPTLVLANVGDGNGLVISAVLGAQLISSVVDTPGSGYQSIPIAAGGVGLASISVPYGGTQYSSTPDVGIDPPDDPDGTQATAVAILGGVISDVTIQAVGSGYTDPDNVTISVTGGGGTGAVLLPIFNAGQLADVVILNPGQGYTTIPTLTVNAVTGSGALISAVIDSIGSVVAINLTCPGTGYTSAPDVVIGGSIGNQALAAANLLGGTSQIVAKLAGSGGLRRLQASPLSHGNAMQVNGYHDDLDENSVIFPEPLNTAFYYNIKADPNLASRYPAVPLAKAAFILNGVELVTSPFNSATLTAANLDSDIILATETVLWPGMAADGSPWDREFSHYIWDPCSGGRDQIIQNTGMTGDPDHWWRLWDNTFNYATARNRAWMHINMASRFVQSARLSSIGVLSPLKAIDLVSGVDAANDGSPITGQVLITLENQVNVLSDPSPQLTLTTLGNLTSIYTNTTGRMVMLSSILFNVTFQLNQSGQSPSAQNCAQVTVGTQEGNYQDIIGAVDGPAAIRLFAVNQSKELFPDADSAAPLIAPNQSVYVRVVLPAGAPIQNQLAVARVKGSVL